MSRSRRALRLTVAAALLLHPGCAEAEDAPPLTYGVDYRIRMLPDQGTAQASIEIEQEAGQVQQIRLRVDPKRYFDFEGSGSIEDTEEGIAWNVPPTGGRLRYVVRINHVRDEAEYDAIVARAHEAFLTWRTIPAPRDRYCTGSWIRPSVWASACAPRPRSRWVRYRWPSQR